MMAMGRAFPSPEPIGSRVNISVTADADIFDADFEAPDNGFWIIQITTDTAGYPKAKMTLSGSATSVTAALNEASDLTANAWYEFWMAAQKGDKINVTFSATATLTVRVFFVRTS